MTLMINRTTTGYFRKSAVQRTRRESNNNKNLDSGQAGMTCSLGGLIYVVNTSDSDDMEIDDYLRLALVNHCQDAA